jgi:hypothetical protein
MTQPVSTAGYRSQQEVICWLGHEQLLWVTADWVVNDKCIWRKKRAKVLQYNSSAAGYDWRMARISHFIWRMCVPYDGLTAAITMVVRLRHAAVTPTVSTLFF